MFLIQWLKNISLCDNQSGVSSSRSTAVAKMKLVEGISTAIDNKEFTVGIFLLNITVEIEKRAFKQQVLSMTQEGNVNALD